MSAQRNGYRANRVAGGGNRADLNRFRQRRHTSSLAGHWPVTHVLPVAAWHSATVALHIGSGRRRLLALRPWKPIVRNWLMTLSTAGTTFGAFALSAAVIAFSAASAPARAADGPKLEGHMEVFQVAPGTRPRPEATWKDGDGKTVSLKDFGGKVVLVNFGPPGAHRAYANCPRSIAWRQVWTAKSSKSWRSISIGAASR